VDSLAIWPDSTAILVPRRPPSNDSRRLLLTTLLIEQHPLSLEPLYKLCPVSRSIRQPAHRRTLLVRAAAPQMTMSTRVLPPSAVLRRRLGIPAELPRAVQQDLPPVAEVLGVRNPHVLAHPVQRVLELLRGEERQAVLLGPLAPHVALRLQRDAPVHRPAAAPARARQHVDGVVRRADEAPVLVEVVHGLGLRHGQLVRGEVVPFIHDQDAVARLGEHLGADAAAAAGADDDDVCLQRRGLGRRLELEEGVVMSFAGDPVARYVRVAAHRLVEGAGDEEGRLCEDAHHLGQHAQGRKPRCLPRLEDGFTDVDGLQVGGCRVACQHESARPRGQGREDPAELVPCGGWDAA